jgi:hypothetical protein
MIRKPRGLVQDLNHKVSIATRCSCDLAGLYSASLKGQCHEIFCFCFFHESVSPPPESIPFRPFRIFSKIRESRCTTGINDTGGKFATGISDTGGKFFTIFANIVDTGGKFATGVNDAGGKFAGTSSKFATGVVDTGGK